MSREYGAVRTAMRYAVIWMMAMNMPASQGKPAPLRKETSDEEITSASTWDDLLVEKKKLIAERKEFEEEVKLLKAELEERQKEIDLKSRTLDERFKELSNVTDLSDHSGQLDEREKRLRMHEEDLRAMRQKFEKDLKKVQMEEEIDRQFSEEEKIKDSLRRREIEDSMTDIEMARNKMAEWHEDMARKELTLVKWETRLTAREDEISQRVKSLNLASNVVNLLQQNRRFYKKKK